MPIVTALAMRYADELQQNYFLIMSIMEEMLANAAAHRLAESRGAHYDTHKVGGDSQKMHTLFALVMLCLYTFRSRFRTAMLLGIGIQLLHSLLTAICIWVK